MNDTGFMQHLEQPQVFNFEIVIDRVRIIKGDQRNYIPAGETDKATKQPSFHGSIKKKKKKKGKKGSKKKGKKGKSKKGSKKSKKGSKKSSKGSSKGSSKKGSKGGSKKGSKGGSKKGSKSSSKKGSPKGKRSPKGKKKKSSKGKKKKSKGGKKGKGKEGSKSHIKKQSPNQEALPGNRKEIPPLRLGINVLGFHDIYINQIDVDPVEEEEFISAGDSPYTAGTGTGTTDSSEHGPVDPLKLAKALEEAQKGKDTKKGRKSKSGKKSKSGSKSKKGSKGGSKKGSKGGSKKGSKGGSKTGSKGGSKTGSKGGSKKGSKKGSKRGSKKGSKRGSKKGSPKGKKRKSKSPKGKKKSGKATPKKKPGDTPSTAATEHADTWSVASETAIKRGRAIMLSEVPRKMITQFQGSPIKIRVERYGGKRHNNGEVIPVGTVTVPFPSDWSEAVLEVQREINPRTYDASAFPIMRGVVGRYGIKDNTNEHIGDILLEMNLYCFANTAVSKLFPTDATLYDALMESENIPKCCDAVTNKRKGKRNNGKPGAYYGYKPGDPNPYEYAWEYARRQKEINSERQAAGTSMYGTTPGGAYGRMMGDYSVTSGGNAEYGRRPVAYTGGAGEDSYGGQPGDCYDLYPNAKKMNYTERFNL